MKPAENIKGAV